MSIKFHIVIILVALSVSFGYEISFAQVSNSSNQTFLNSTIIPVSNVSSLPNVKIENNSNLEPLQNQLVNETSPDVNNFNIMSYILISERTQEQNLTKLFNSTIDSIVEIASFDSNQSIYKVGTGFIADINGTLSLLSSNNLVTANDDVTVTLSHGNMYESQLLGYDPVTNLALLSIDAIPQDQIIPLTLANSTNLQVGQAIVTIGNSMGFSNLLTTGIVSGVEKSIPTFGQNVSSSLTKIPNGIITDLSTHSTGYGGSPLLNIDGQVIGMNIQNHSSDIQDTSPISFAIPSNSIIKIISELNTKGYYLHPWLGVSGTDVTPDIAKVLKLEESRGFLVIAVSDQSPAKLAGILGGDNVTNVNGRPVTLGGDIILEVDDKDIKSIHDILTYIENEKNVGDNMVITVNRNGILQSINVLLQSNPNYMSSLN